MTINSAPLVGSHFHAPAKAILACLPQGAAVTVVPEPENPFDENALKVMVPAHRIPESQHEKLGMLLGGYGYQLEEFLEPIPDAEGRPSSKEWMIGHIKRDFAADWASRLQGERRGAVLVFDADGKPSVEIELSEPKVAL